MLVDEKQYRSIWRIVSSGQVFVLDQRRLPHSLWSFIWKRSTNLSLPFTAWLLGSTTYWCDSGLRHSFGRDWRLVRSQYCVGFHQTKRCAPNSGKSVIDGQPCVWSHRQSVTSRAREGSNESCRKDVTGRFREKHQDRPQRCHFYWRDRPRRICSRASSNFCESELPTET